MGQPTAKYAVLHIIGERVEALAGVFDSEEQAEHAAIELAEAHSAAEYRVYELKSRWKTQTRVERV